MRSPHTARKSSPHCCCCCCVASVVTDSVLPHRWQPTRLPCLWDSPGKNTGVGCHFLLQCMKVKSEREVAQLYVTLSNPMDCSLPGSFASQYLKSFVDLATCSVNISDIFTMCSGRCWFPAHSSSEHTHSCLASYSKHP